MSQKLSKIHQTKRICLDELNSEKVIVAKYKKELPMLDFLFKQQAEKLQEEIKDIEAYECHKRIIKELIEGQDVDIIIKTIINIKIDYLFFDIKLTDIEKNTIESYIEEFDPDSYETFNSQPFDSTKKFNFICLYYKTLKERKEALNIIEKKEEYFNKHLYENTKEIKQ
ncbi:717_t:CDS:2, partial [Gigaspora rosea]